MSDLTQTPEVKIPTISIPMTLFVNLVFNETGFIDDDNPSYREHVRILELSLAQLLKQADRDEKYYHICFPGQDFNNTKFILMYPIHVWRSSLAFWKIAKAKQEVYNNHADRRDDKIKQLKAILDKEGITNTEMGEGLATWAVMTRNLPFCKHYGVDISDLPHDVTTKCTIV